MTGKCPGRTRRNAVTRPLHHPDLREVDSTRTPRASPYGNAGTRAAVPRLVIDRLPPILTAAMFLAVSLVLALAPGRADASNLEAIQVFALGPLDGRAVFRFPDGKMAVLKLGDTLEGTRARLVQVLGDRAVLEDVREEAGQPAVRELVWLYKADASGRSTLRRFSPQAPAPARIERAK